jgi:predicted GIY-YIG superfamily endonuclease
MDTEGRFTVYMIHAGNKTYIGYTVCQKRRLRQHNKELKGGARATRVASGWQYFCTLSSADWTSVRAQQVEWIAKHPTRQRKCPAKYRGVHGRVASLIDLCSHVPEPLTIRLRPDLLQMAQALPLPDRITLLPLPQPQLAAVSQLVRTGMGTDEKLPTTALCTVRESSGHMIACTQEGSSHQVSAEVQGI